jgi:hypothetical protein
MTLMYLVRNRRSGLRQKHFSTYNSRLSCFRLTKAGVPGSQPARYPFSTD